MMTVPPAVIVPQEEKAETINVQLSDHETRGVLDYVSGFDSGRGLG